MQRQRGTTMTETAKCPNCNSTNTKRAAKHKGQNLLQAKKFVCLWCGKPFNREAGRPKQ
jgi:transposase-like protein